MLCSPERSRSAVDGRAEGCSVRERSVALAWTRTLLVYSTCAHIAYCACAGRMYNSCRRNVCRRNATTPVGYPRCSTCFTRAGSPKRTYSTLHHRRVQGAYSVRARAVRSAWARPPCASVECSERSSTRE